MLVGLGYVLAIATSGAILSADTSKGSPVMLAVAALLGIMVAWLVWMPAVWRLGAFTSKHGLTLRLNGGLLHCTDRKSHRVLRVRDVQFSSRNAEGIGYKFVRVKLETTDASIHFASDERWDVFAIGLQEAKELAVIKESGTSFGYRESLRG